MKKAQLAKEAELEEGEYEAAVRSEQTNAYCEVTIMNMSYQFGSLDKSPFTGQNPAVVPKKQHI